MNVWSCQSDGICFNCARFRVCSVCILEHWFIFYHSILLPHLWSAAATATADSFLNGVAGPCSCHNHNAEVSCSTSYRVSSSWIRSPLDSQRVCDIRSPFDPQRVSVSGHSSTRYIPQTSNLDKKIRLLPITLSSVLYFIWKHFMYHGIFQILYSLSPPH